jgi:predicted alpha/beta-hydrolase family hydrolase
MRDRLAAAGFTTLTFDYAYTAEGRKAPDRLPKLVQVHTAAAQRLANESDSVILAGKSMGGRVGGHVAAEGQFPAEGVVYLGYPLVAMGKKEPRDTSHLLTLDIPQLFISGTRDPMGPVDLVREVASSVPEGRFIPVDGGDHSLVPLKRSGRTRDDSLDEATAAIVDWWAATAR